MKEISTLKLSVVSVAFLIVSFLVSVTNLQAQVSLTAPGTYTQNFDGMGTAATATLPTGWKMSAAGAAAPTWSSAGNFTATTQAASSGVPTAGGRYNWGNGTTTTDRAIGFMTSGSYATPNSVMAAFTNNYTGNELTSFTASFNYERYRINTTAASVAFYYSTDGSTWIAQTSGNSGAFSTGASAYGFPLSTISISAFTVTFGTPLSVGQSFYLRWDFTTAGSNSQGLGLDDVNVTPAFAAVGGNDVSGLSTSNTCVDRTTLSWTNPATLGTVLVFAKAGSAVVPGSPTAAASSYTANAAFGSGDVYEGDASAFLVYKGTGTSVAVTNLSPGTTYHFLVYNVTGTNAYSTGAVTNVTTPAAVSTPFSIGGSNGIGLTNLTWTNPSCYDEILIIGKAGAAPTSVPTGNGSAYTANNAFGTAGTDANLNTGEYAVYKGTASAVTVSNLVSNVTYQFRIYARVGNYWSTPASISRTPTSPTAITGTSISSTCGTTATINWSTGSLSSASSTILVFLKAGSAITTGTPSAATASLTANSVFDGSGSAFENDPNAYLVFKGFGGPVTVTGLTPGTQYFYAIYNVQTGTYSAAYSNATTGSTTTPVIANVSAFTGSAGVSQATLSWTNPTSCFDEILIVGKQGSAPTSVPTGNGTLYTANASFGTTGTGANLNAGEFAVYKASAGTSATITNLVNGSTYYFTTFVRRGNYWSTGSTISVTPNVPQDIIGLTFTASCIDAGTLSWTNPAGFNPANTTILIFAKQGATPVSAGTPTVAASTYTASSTFGSGSPYQNDPAAFLVYKGTTTATSAAISGLTPGASYQFLAYNVSNNNDIYSTGVTASGTQPSAPSPVTGVAAATANGSVSLTWTNPTACIDEILVIAKAGGAPTSVPTGDGTLYTATDAFDDPNTNNNANLNAGEYAVYQGSGSSAVVYNLSNGTSYTFAVYVRYGTAWSTAATVSATPTTPVGDYMTAGSGNWTDNTTWLIWNGTAYVPTTLSTQWPNLSSASVIIQTGHTVVISGTGNFSVKNLTVQSGAKLWTNTSNTNNRFINVYGTFVKCDGIIGNANPALLDNVSLHIESGTGALGTTISSPAGTGQVSVARLRKSTNSPNATSQVTINMNINVNWNGAAIYNDVGASSMFNVIIAAGRTVNVPNGDVAMDGSNGVTSGLAGGTITVNGTLNVAGTTILSNNNSGTFSTNLTIGNGGLVNTVSYTGNTSGSTAGSTLTINGGTLKVTGAPSPFSFTGSTNTFTFATNAIVEYAGTVNQNVVATLPYRTLKINNPAGVTLLANTVVSNILDLTNGLVNTGAFQVQVTNNAAAAVSNYSIASYVNGKLERSITGTGTYDFPVGTASWYELAQLKTNALVGTSSIAASFTGGVTTQPNVTVNGVLINTLLNAGFWTLTPNAQPTGGTYDVTLYERGHTNAASISQQQYTVLKRTNSAASWTHQGTTVGNSQLAGGGVVMVPNYGLGSFSDFAIGFGNAVLPVTLTSFDATARGNDVLVTWHTESELHNAFFDVETSTNGNDFYRVGTVAGHGTSVEAHSYQFVHDKPANGVNYYRLKQVDDDGGFTYSQIRAVDFTSSKQSSYSIFPVPANDLVVINGLVSGDAVHVYGSDGRLKTSFAFVPGTERLNIVNWPNGYYNVKVENKTGVTTLRFLKN